MSRFGFPKKIVLSQPIVWLGDYAFDSKMTADCVALMIKLGYDQSPGLLFPHDCVLSKLILGLADYAFNSKSESRLCGCSVFD